jgi:hypothetical protein
VRPGAAVEIAIGETEYSLTRSKVSVVAASMGS